MFPLHLTDLEQVKHVCTNALFHIVEEDNIYSPKSPKKWSDNQILSIGLSYNPSFPFIFQILYTLGPKNPRKIKVLHPQCYNP